MIIPASKTIHQENDVRLAKFCSHSLEIYQVTGMAMTTAMATQITSCFPSSITICHFCAPFTFLIPISRIRLRLRSDTNPNSPILAMMMLRIEFDSQPGRTQFRLIF